MNASTILKKLISFQTTERKYNNQIKEYILSLLKKLDKQVFSIPNTENRSFVVKLGNRKKRKRPLIFLSHLDTVIPTNEWEKTPWNTFEENGRIIGLGASDMKGSIASLLVAIFELGNKVNEFYLAFTSDEETTVSNIKKVKKFLEAKNALAIATEPTQGNLKVGQKGVFEIKISMPGQSLHADKASRKENKKNSAIYKIAEVINFIKEQELQFDQRNDRKYGKSVTNFGKIEGGSMINVMPESCSLEISYRLVPSASADKIYQELKRKVKKIDPKAKIEILLNGGSFDNRNKKTTGILLNIVRREIESAEAIHSRGGWSEVVEFNNENNDLFILGPGEIDQAHQANEFIKVDKLNKFVKVYGNILKNSSL